MTKPLRTWLRTLALAGMPLPLISCNQSGVLRVSDLDAGSFDLLGVDPGVDRFVSADVEQRLDAILGEGRDLRMLGMDRGEDAPAFIRFDERMFMEERRDALVDQGGRTS